MLRLLSSSTAPAKARRPLFRSFRRDARGATAIEFALVGGPFLMMLFGIIAVGLFYFTTFSMENAVEQASRVLRTGQAQQSGMTAAQFKSKVCEFVPGHIDCNGKVFVNVRSFTTSAEVDAAPAAACLNAAGQINSTQAFTPGTQNAVVLVWLCYEWDMAKFPWINFGNMANGSMLIQATTTFRTEPYTN